MPWNVPLKVVPMGAI